MSSYKDYLNEKKEYSLSDFMYSNSEAFNHGIFNSYDDKFSNVTFLELVERFQESKPFHAGIATWQKIIAFAFAKKLSADDTNDILQEYHFTVLYPKSLLESSIIFALSIGMNAEKWVGLYEKYKALFEKEQEKRNTAVFGKRVEKREFYCSLVETKRHVDAASKAAMTEELLNAIKSTTVADRSVILNALDEYYKGKTATSALAKKIISLDKRKKEDKDRIRETKIYYILAKNSSFRNSQDIEVLYNKLKNYSSSLLSLSIVKMNVDGVDPENSYKQLKPFFDESFTLDELYEMLLMFSKETPDSIDSFGVTLDSTNQEISQWLSEAIEKQNFRAFYINAQSCFESIRYKKRRYLFKYLYYLCQEKIDRFVEFEKDYLGKVYSDKELLETKTQYLHLAKNTLIKALPQMCVKNFKLSSLSEEKYLDTDTLSKMGITFSSLFFDFSSFWGNYNLIGRAFINKFEVYVYRSNTPIKDVEEIKDVEGSHTLIMIPKGKKELILAFNKEIFCKEYHLDFKDEKEIKKLFTEKLSANIKGWDGISANSIEWLIDRSNLSSWEDLVDDLLEAESFESQANDTTNTLSKQKKQVDNRYQHDYKIFKDILTGKQDASRDFLMMFAVYCGAEIDEIEEHLLVNVGYFMLDDNRPLDCLITALSIEPDLDIRRRNFFKIIEELDLAYESDEIGSYLLQNEMLNAMCSETHEILLH